MSPAACSPLTPATPPNLKGPGGVGSQPPSLLPSHPRCRIARDGCNGGLRSRQRSHGDLEDVLGHASEMTQPAGQFVLVRLFALRRPLLDVAFTRAKQRAFFTLCASRGKPIDWLENILLPAGVQRLRL